MKGGRKGNAWWTQEIKEAIEDKKRAYKSIAKKLTEEIRERRRSEYKSCSRKVKGFVNESKRKVDEEFGRKLSEHFFENKSCFGRRLKERD